MRAQKDDDDDDLVTFFVSEIFKYETLLAVFGEIFGHRLDAVRVKTARIVNVYAAKL